LLLVLWLSVQQLQAAVAVAAVAAAVAAAQEASLLDGSQQQFYLDRQNRTKLPLS
jgi:hypothetical protein